MDMAMEILRKLARKLGVGKSLQRAALIRLPTRHGEFSGYGYRERFGSREHLALVYGDVRKAGAPLVRVHSACLTGDIFGSLRCDCGPQLENALAQITAAGAGIVLYLDQEGRGIGLINKLRAYELQERGMDTIEANLALGFPADDRDFRVAAEMLEDLGVSGIRLLTNNPDKVKTLVRAGVRIDARVPLEVRPNAHNRFYLETKRVKAGHFLEAHAGTPRRMMPPTGDLWGPPRFAPVSR